jgi:hypothetical protein
MYSEQYCTRSTLANHRIMDDTVPASDDALWLIMVPPVELAVSTTLTQMTHFLVHSCDNSQEFETRLDATAT